MFYEDIKTESKNAAILKWMMWMTPQLDLFHFILMKNIVKLVAIVQITTWMC